VPLSKGEIYEIWVENRTDAPVLMRLLVDGLNTLPEKAPPKGLAVEETASPAVYLPAQRVNLGDARAWLIDPSESPVVAVRGFFFETGEKGACNEFIIVDAPDSLASRQQFTDQLGLITAAFYAPAPGKRGLGTSPGAGPISGTGAGSVLKQGSGVHDLQVGNLLAVVHIRYAPPEAIDAATPK